MIKQQVAALEVSRGVSRIPPDGFRGGRQGLSHSRQMDPQAKGLHEVGEGCDENLALDRSPFQLERAAMVTPFWTDCHLRVRPFS